MYKVKRKGTQLNKHKAVRNNLNLNKEIILNKVKNEQLENPDYASEWINQLAEIKPNFDRQENKTAKKSKYSIKWWLN